MRRIRIGRSETNDIVIPDASVSRQHAEAVELGGGRFSLSDLGSTFGTQAWQGQGWVAAKDTEIDADTVIRFGEFRTTLRDVLSEADRMALGLSRSAPPPPAPTAAAPAAPPAPSPLPPKAEAGTSATPKVAPRTAAPDTPAAPPSPRLQPAERPPAERAPATRDARAAARPARSAAGGKRRAMVLGLMATGGFFAVAAGVVAVALTFGDPNGAKPRPDPGTAAGEGPQRFLEACKTNWGIEERRCRCFLAAAGPHLEPADYDDFTTLVQGHVEGDSAQMESVMQQAGEKRGATASARLSAAMKGVTRDCQAEPEPPRQ